MTSSLLPMTAAPSPLPPSSVLTADPKRAVAQAEYNLITRVLDGESSLFHALVSPCERSMFFMALSLLGNEADAEDAVQEAALKAYRALAGFRRESSFSTWLIQITINEARAMLRKKRRYVVESLDTSADSEDDNQAAREIPDDRERPLEALLRKETGEVLTRALNALPPKYRAVVKLRDIEGFNTEETAEMLGVSEANVKTRLCRARLRLKNTIGPNVWSSRGCAPAAS